MEQEHDELRFVCKLCDKKYPSGKSLGGHMRSHVMFANVENVANVSNVSNVANSSESDEKFATLMIANANGSGSVNEIGNPSSYGLRENPKKTWRAVGAIGAVGSSTFTFQNERICKQCGKGFQSLKALCGHMACHSEKDRNFKDYDHSWTSENIDHEEKVLIDSHSESDEEPEEPDFEDPTRVTRSKSKRYKKVVIKPFSFTNNNTNSNNSNYNYGSSSISEIDEFEQEEVAMCLMMLSKDSSNWGGVNSVVESSDNNSAVFENSAKKVESDISVEELLRNGDPNKKSKGMFDKTREFTYEEKLEIRRNLFKEFGYRDSLKKRILDEDDAYNPELEREPTKKKNKYECLTCNKVFSSFQGLGGHRPCSKRNAYVSKKDSGENSIEGQFGHTRKPKYDKKIKVKKSKGHECPICFRMFKSGQALGGHKRSHFINGSVDHFTAYDHGAPSSSDMIDLNLPAPEED